MSINGLEFEEKGYENVGTVCGGEGQRAKPQNPARKQCIFCWVVSRLGQALADRPSFTVSKQAVRCYRKVVLRIGHDWSFVKLQSQTKQKPGTDAVHGPKGPKPKQRSARIRAAVPSEESTLQTDLGQV